MTVLTRTANQIGRVFPTLDVVMPIIVGATVTAGQVVTPGTLKYVLADANAGSGLEEARGIIIKGARDGEGADLLIKGWLAGYNFGSLALDALLFLSDTPGEVDDTVSATNPVRIGRVWRMTDAPDYTRVGYFNFEPFWRGSTLAG